MSIETGCPPHEVVLDDVGRLVCRLCGTVVHGGDCLACIIEPHGWRAWHVCDSARRNVRRDHLVLLLVYVALAALAVAVLLWARLGVGE